ncbi:SusD-like starch-binding protein associating with outer membrane [Aquimarina sp. MAR_2010_214]|uniref:RagB/SusD family nutrient uptake outer membrane protein n=1 Tax=Aquimarina sp. MAR_2010_214 TaxID=1250026 RepID=UPI000C706414|nr:RagB/SusD family nutrient uptake outer membrane protein [Aquimarina sp. MAR_2010_214]PKV52666.1 SusD-like starch-binding protein associating with outer membrane [Aquimarina sp. MAR_2010_214]
MKNNISKLIVLFLTFGFFACDDELNDLQPFTEVNPETFLTDLSSFQNGIDGIYLQMRNYYASPGSGYQGIPDILSDNTIQVQSGRKSNDVYHDYRYVATTAGAIQLYWSEAYEAINVANIVIGQIDNLSASAEKNNILGQALAARAWAHFDLVRMYGQVPTQNTGANASLGVVYLKVEDGDTGDPLATPSRETVAENYSEIIEDLERASTLIGTSNGEGRLDKNGVYGLLSRIYLYNGEYQKAIDAANEVTTPLATVAQLPGVYTDSNNAGIVIELGINTATETTNNNVGVLYSQANSSNDILEYAIDFGFFNSVSNDDARKDVMQYVASNTGVSFNGIKKFLGEEGQINGRADIKVLRAAEVVLNKAEAQFELNQESAALTSLNQLRAVRYSPFVAGTETGTALEDAIQFERRVELSFEGHRFFDIKRRGESISRSNNGEVIDGTGTAPEALTIPAGNFRFQFPIPQAEINANTGFSGQQNSGY